MPRRIGVMGVCDSGALALTLSILLPEETVQVVSWPQGSEDAQQAWFLTAKGSFDVLLINDILAPRIKDLTLVRQSGLDCRVYPHIHFHAFHPDMTYASRMVGNEHELLKTGYNSSIVLWCYLSDAAPEAAAAMFTGDVFERLGYFAEWDASVEPLRTRFGECGLDFRRFFQKVKRDGIFMLSSNHPRVATISALAGRIAVDLLEAPEAVTSLAIYMADHLAQSSFPVYPEIGDYYGHDTTYDFFISGKTIGLVDYIRWAYGQYELVGPKPIEFFYGRPGLRAKLDAVLSERLG